MLTEKRYSWGYNNCVSRALRNLVGHSETDFIAIKGCNYIYKIASSFSIQFSIWSEPGCIGTNQILSRSLKLFLQVGF